MPKARNIGHIRAFVVISTWPPHDCRRNSRTGGLSASKKWQKSSPAKKPRVVGA